MEMQDITTVDNTDAKKQESSLEDQTGSGEVPQTPAPEEVPAVVTIHDIPYLQINVAMSVLAFIAIVGSLYLARAFFVPLLIGILASYALSPVVEWMKRRHVPRSLGAAFVLITLVGGISWMSYSLSDDAAAMIEKLPEAARKLRQNLSDDRTGPTALQNMQEAATQIEGAAGQARSHSKRSRAFYLVARLCAGTVRIAVYGG
jgi:predicted PurR-regulated permease PerM